MNEMRGSSFLQGTPGKKTLCHDTASLHRGSFRQLGQLVALTALQGGSGIQCFSTPVVKYLLHGSLDTGDIDDVPDPLVQTALREVSVFSHITQDLDVELILQCVHFDAKCTFYCRSNILCDVRLVEYTYIVVIVQVNDHNMLAYQYISDGVSANN